MRARLANLIVGLTLVCAIGGHWMILQSIAWCGMVVSYSQHSSLAEALVKTFNGKHPCTLCKVVQNGKKEESKQTFLKLESKLDLLLVRSTPLLYPPPMPRVMPGEADNPKLRSLPPLLPPPRLA